MTRMLITTIATRLFLATLLSSGIDGGEDLCSIFNNYFNNSHSSMQIVQVKLLKSDLYVL
jgi:hypothetical protein